MRTMPSMRQVRRAFTDFVLALVVFGVICTGLLASNGDMLGATDAIASGWPGDETLSLAANSAFSSSLTAVCPDLSTIAGLALALSLITVFNLAFVRHLSQTYAAPRRKRRVNT